MILKFHVLNIFLSISFIGLSLLYIRFVSDYCMPRGSATRNPNTRRCLKRMDSLIERKQTSYLYEVEQTTVFELHPQQFLTNMIII